MTINTIDLWTEQYENHYEVFNGAFVDGFSNDNVPFDSYKLVKNCNCIIEISNKDINIRNKHHALIFYKDNVPVRLMVINENTDIDKCIDLALNQFFNNETLKEVYERNSIKSSIIDLKEKPIYNSSDKSKELDVGSCDRWSLLYNMLKGSYTEDESSYGNFENDKYEFLPNIYVRYHLVTGDELFEIVHKCGFINHIKTRIIIIQENSPLTSQ